jgi:hypothetical protein
MDARAALDSASLKLGGLRTALGEPGTQLVEVYDQVAAAIPGHIARVAEAFEAEWQAALGAWCEVLGRRAEIERVLGMALDLADPLPAAVTIDADVSRPSETLSPPSPPLFADCSWPIREASFSRSFLCRISAARRSCSSDHITSVEPCFDACRNLKCPDAGAPVNACLAQ